MAGSDAADEYAADLTTPVPCPMACGRTTEDPYGGPCPACWDKAPDPWADDGPATGEAPF